MKYKRMTFLLLIVLLPTFAKANCNGKTFKLFSKDDPSVFIEVEGNKTAADGLGLKFCHIDNETSEKSCEGIFSNVEKISGKTDYLLASLPTANAAVTSLLTYVILSPQSVATRWPGLITGAVAAASAASAYNLVSKGVSKSRANKLKKEIDTLNNTGQCSDKTLDISKKSLISSLPQFETKDLNTKAFKNKHERLERIANGGREPGKRGFFQKALGVVTNFGYNLQGR